MTAVPTDSLMRMVLAGHAHQRALSDPDVFADAVQALMASVNDNGAPCLVPADVDAAALIGGAIVAGGGAIRQARPDADGHLPNKVMVVGATTVSGKLVRDQVVASRALGCDWVGAWMWRAPASITAEVLSADQVVSNGSLTDP
ncbi:hypothetical protein [Microbacterium sp.]|uniref:hypothetical protein n=1 Tax=Microbacterium sp. TaxID=51671 RepID=UPI0027337430|nr:hypothetical protein [Microbacterium sp.]MDP3950541.1 hypothetical protein [Microbacterium sp.]